MRTWLPLVITAPLLLRGEIVDRIAASVGRQVITQSAIEEQIRITAFLNQETPDLDPAVRRRMAERLIEQLLLRQEMEISRFGHPAAPEAEPLLSQIRRQRFASGEAMETELRKLGISMEALRRNLLLQLATLRFVELRFRPGSAVSDGEIELHYRDVFAPEWEKRNGGAVPGLEDVRERIEAELLQRKVDQSLDEWLKQARAQAKVRFFEEAFR